MTKVSKNIKKARSRLGLTQDALAERVHVTRQTVSSWETGRTQPDLDMLLQLCAALEVPPEELLYGEKRNTSLDAPPVYRGTVKIVLTVLSSLFIAAGVLLVFLNGWESLPLPVRYACSFVPLLFGQIAAAFVLLKKRESPAHAEGGGILWALGLVATAAMLCVLQRDVPDFPLLMLLAAALSLPAFVLLRALSVLLCFFVGAATFASTAVDDWSALAQMSEPNAQALVFAVFTLLVTAGLLAAKFVLPKLDGQRRRLGQWVCLFAAGAWCVSCASLLETGVFPMLFACAVALYALDGIGRERPLSSRWLGLPFALVLLLIASAGVLFSLPYEWTFSPIMLPGFALLGAVPLAAVAANRNVLRHDPLRVVQLCLFCAAIVFYLVMYLTENDTETKRIVVFQSITFALGVLLILQGAKENALFKINLGFLSICTLAGYLVWHADFKLWLKGLILLCFGALLFVINRAALSRKQKAMQQSQIAEPERQVEDA